MNDNPNISKHVHSDAYTAGLGRYTAMKTTVTARPVTTDDAEAYRYGFDAGYEYGQQS